MFSILISSAIGCVINRVRGGLLSAWLDGKGLGALIGGKMINDVVFTLWFNILIGLTYLGIVDNTPTYDTDFNIYALLILAGAMWLGRAPGWGEYITGMINQQDTSKKEIEQIDELVRVGDPNDKPVLRNMAALSLRGVMWTLSLTAGFVLVKCFFYDGLSLLKILSLAPLGLIMGPIYLLTINIADRLPVPRGQGWPYGEYTWGAILWGYCSFIVL